MQSRAELLEQAGGSALGAREAALLGVFAYEERRLLTVDDVLDVLPVSRPAANRMLCRLCGKGWLRRLERGLYARIPASEPIEEPWPLAMGLFHPCYISGASAAARWRLADKAHHSVVVVTARPQRRAEQTRGGVAFRTRTVRRDKIFGTRTVEIDGCMVDVADPERLVLDILDEPALAGGIRDALAIVHAYAGRDGRDVDRLLGHAKRLGKPAVLRRVGFLADVLDLASPSWLVECQRHCGQDIRKLDPNGKEHGPIVRRWRLRLNVPMAHILPDDEVASEVGGRSRAGGRG